MKTYACGNCGYILPGLVGRCPRCGVLLSGEQEGDEAERQRRDREYRRNSPEARARREKLSMIIGGVGTFLIALLVIALFVGGCGAMGWFVLPRLLGKEAILPLTIGSAVLGGTLLFSLGRWFIDVGDLYGPFRSPQKPWDEADRKHRSKIFRLSIVLCLALVPILGAGGWIVAKQNRGDITIIAGIAGGVMLLYWIAPLAKRYLGWTLSNLLEFELGPLWSFGILFFVGFTAVLFILRNPNSASIAGIVAAPLLAYYLASRWAGPPPDTWKMRQEALLGTVMQNPSSIRDLDPSDQQIVLFELQKLARAAPDAWKRLPRELQALIPPPELSPEQKNTGTSRRRAARSPKPETEQKNTPPQPTAKVFEEPEEATVVLDDLPAIVFCPTYYYNGDVDCSKEVWSVHEIYDRDGKRLKPVFSRNWNEIAQGIATRNPQIRRRKGKKEELCHEAICILPEACPVRVVFKCVSESSNDRSRLDRSSHTKLVEMIFQKSHEKSSSEKTLGRLFGAKRSSGRHVKS